MGSVVSHCEEEQQEHIPSKQVQHPGASETCSCFSEPWSVDCRGS